MAGRLVALLVGIDVDPPPIPALQGCVNDVRAVADVLRTRVPPGALSLRVVEGAEATRGATIAAITGHLGSAGADDVALLYFSGHGSQGKAPEELWPVEPDRLVETLVLVDSRQPGQWDLADKELAVLLAGVAARGPHVVTVLDCCHSGGGTRSDEGVQRLRLAPADDRVRPLASFLPGVADAAGAGAVRSLGARWSSGTGSQVLLAACRSSETAKETRIGGRPRGALSAALEEALRGGGTLTYRQLHRHATAAVARRVEGQHPQLEATRVADLDRPFLGGAVGSLPPQLLVSHLPEGWCVDAGAVHGIPEGRGDDSTEFAVHALEGPTTTTPLATATVTRVLPDRSLVDLSAALDPALVYRAVVTSIPLPPLRVAVVGDGPDVAALRAAAADADPTLVAITPHEADADVVVRSTAGGFTVTRPGVRRPVVDIVAGERRAGRTVDALERVARWLRLSGLANPLTGLPAGAVEVRLEASDGRRDEDGHLDLRYAGDTAPTFAVWLRNASDRSLWCALIDLTDAYGIYPDALPEGSVALGPGESTRVDLSGEVPDELWAQGVDSVTDRLLLVVSTLEFDPRSLHQDDLDAGASGPPPRNRGIGDPRTTLGRLLARVTTRRLAPPTASAVADWRTDDYLVVTVRPLSPSAAS